MCGIAGIVDYKRPMRAHAGKLAEMRALLGHRGTDGQGTLLFNHAGLVHTRLAIIDVAGSAQPFRSADGRWAMTYNGEVYNYRQIRNELKNFWDFKTEGDTEVVLAAWARWGADCLHRLNGMFAFFIWDNQTQKGWLARDMLGVKPAVWRFENGVFAFASEAKALVKTMETPVRASEEAVLEYLAAPFFSGVETSMFAGIENLQPGAMIEISDKGIQKTDWTDYAIDPQDGAAPDLSGLLRDAVERTMIADVPVCTLLSGGFDSTLITALAQKFSSEPMDSYTITFPGQDGFHYSDSTMTNADDTPYAIGAAREIGARYNAVPAGRETLSERIRAIAVINDALPAWEQELAQHSLSAAAGGNYKVVLVGDAADETHYGYHFLLDPQATMTPANILKRFVKNDVINPARMKDAGAHFDAQYKKFAAGKGYHWGRSANDNILATTYLIVKRWLPRLLHNGDIHAMNFSLEARVPFCDTELLDITRRISPKAAYREGREKAWLRDCSAGLLPENIRQRKKSALPKDQNVAGIYQSELARVLELDDGFVRHFIDADNARKLCAGNVVPDEKDRAFMFRTICLFHWHRHYNVGV